MFMSVLFRYVCKAGPAKEPKQGRQRRDGTKYIQCWQSRQAMRATMRCISTRQALPVFLFAFINFAMVQALCVACLSYAWCQRCAWCGKAGPWYCSGACQSQHWASAHAAECGSKAFRDGMRQQHPEVPRHGCAAIRGVHHSQALRAGHVRKVSEELFI